MADDPPSETEAEDLPQAREAFTSDNRELRLTTAYAISRAGAILTVVRPPMPRPTDDSLAEEEARELLQLDPIEVQVDRGEIVGLLDDLGSPASRAAAILRRPEAESGRHELRSVAAAWATDLDPWHGSERETVELVQREAAVQLFANTESQARERFTRPGSAVRLVAASLFDEHPLVRIAAAVAMLRIDPDNPLAAEILDQRGRGSGEVAELARAALLNARRYDYRRVEIETTRGAVEAEPDSVLVHGTWARRGRWWRPSGDLHTFLRDQQVFPKLYAGRDNFAWSGFFTLRTWGGARKDWERQQAGSHLAWWAERRLAAPPDVVGHSYGGSISMLATQVEKHIRGLVLLSPAYTGAVCPTLTSTSRYWSCGCVWISSCLSIGPSRGFFDSFRA